MKLVKNFGNKDQELLAIDLKVGELAILQSSGDIVLRIYREIVSLNDPKATWDEVAMRQHRVKRLLPGESVTLIQE